MPIGLMQQYKQKSVTLLTLASEWLLVRLFAEEMLRTTMNARYVCHNNKCLGQQMSSTADAPDNYYAWHNKGLP